MATRATGSNGWTLRCSCRAVTLSAGIGDRAGMAGFARAPPFSLARQACAGGAGRCTRKTQATAATDSTAAVRNAARMPAFNASTGAVPCATSWVVREDISATKRATPAAPATCWIERKHGAAVRIQLGTNRRQAGGEQRREQQREADAHHDVPDEDVGDRGLRAELRHRPQHGRHDEDAWNHERSRADAIVEPAHVAEPSSPISRPPGNSSKPGLQRVERRARSADRSAAR